MDKLEKIYTWYVKYSPSIILISVTSMILFFDTSGQSCQSKEQLRIVDWSGMLMLVTIGFSGATQITNMIIKKLDKDT